jgi:hypothetical protein
MGKEKAVRYLSPEHAQEFQLLSHLNHECTSDETTLYNCIAYAAGDESKWWQPEQLDDRPTFWPEGAITDYSLEALISVFEILGYTECNDGTLEPGFEKVALYAKANGEYGHAARQEPDGYWKSKLGDWEDIRHRTPEVVQCPGYGDAVKYMKRPTLRTTEAT